MGNVPTRYDRQASRSTSVQELNAHQEVDEEIAISNNSNANTNNQNQAQQANNANNNTQRNVRTPGLYFGQFFLGGNNIHDPNQVFGNGRTDLAFLSSIGARPPPPPVHQVTTVKCPVNLSKHSLQIVPIDETNKKLYKVQFMLDCTESCSVTVHYAATETFTESNESIFIPPTTHSTAHFERGLGQVYEQPSNDYFDASLYKEEELVYNADNNYYPLVVVIQTDSDKKKQQNQVTVSSDKSQQQQDKVTCQITYAAVIHCADDSYVIKPMKQKIRYNGKSYIIHEMYGLESADTDGGRECVICMTDPRDTTVLPCRHLCLCSSCAEVLRHQSNKCPICRSTVKSMVEIKIQKDGSDNDDDNKDKKYDSDSAEPDDSADDEPKLIKKEKTDKSTIPLDRDHDTIISNQ